MEQGMAPPLIEFRQVTAQFGAEVIFSAVSLSIVEHEFICLLGPSGCGKSTMIRMIGGLIKPSQGAVRVAGQPPRIGRNALAYVFQSPRLVPWRNARDNVGLSIQLRAPAVGKAERQERSARLLRMVGLANDGHKFPSMLSGGERQRVAIARALAVEPSIILMDEPFSALDPDTRRRMRGDLVALWQETRKTIVFVTHDLDEAIELADRIVVFSGKPTRILETVALDEPRPRTINASPVLHDVRNHLLNLFKGQSSIQWRDNT
jgi:NitT/TauT family transport system ATP-binding protein